MDQLLTFLASLAPQHWLALGLILLIAEMASGTTYLLWPAMAAFITAAVSWSGLTNWAAELGVFAALVIALTALGRPLVRKLRSQAPDLNERSAQMIGVRGVLANFADGVGSMRVNDTVWRAVSDEALQAGQHVEITAIDGVTLKVKQAS